MTNFCILLFLQLFLSGVARAVDAEFEGFQSLNIKLKSSLECQERDERYFEILRQEIEAKGRIFTAQEVALFPDQLRPATKLVLEIIAEAQIKPSDVFGINSIISSLDVGDQSSKILKKYHGKIQTLLGRATKKSFQKKTCYAPEQFARTETPLPILMNQYAHWSLATAYQSCNAPQNILRSYTAPLEGIEIVGRHPDGVGLKRVIGDLAKVQQTHPYIETQYEKQCVPVRNSPLIYDYGGKPWFTSDLKSPLDFFRDNGDGTEVLGIDCSGFVFSIFATGGLKLKSGRQLRASDSVAWSSHAYVDPIGNGIDCLKLITVNSNEKLQAGDVIAVPGHVLMVDSVGADPFGIAALSKIEDCSKVNSDNFNFTIIQSSNSLNGIGINRFFAADYFSSSPKFRPGLEEYARLFCESKFNKKSIRPKIKNLSITRHLNSKACIAQRIPLAHEDCVQSCNWNR